MFQSTREELEKAQRNITELNLFIEVAKEELDNEEEKILQSKARQNAAESPGTDKQHAQVEICQIITEEIMMFMGGADMLVACSTERMVQIRNSVQSIVAGKLSAVR